MEIFYFPPESCTHQPATQTPHRKGGRTTTSLRATHVPHGPIPRPSSPLSSLSPAPRQPLPAPSGDAAPPLRTQPKFAPPRTAPHRTNFSPLLPASRPSHAPRAAAAEALTCPSARGCRGHEAPRSSRVPPTWAGGPARVRQPRSAAAQAPPARPSPVSLTRGALLGSDARRGLGTRGRRYCPLPR